ncbi:MAG: hypothetical protein AB1325_06920 [Nitrospirota bacterium]
MNSKMTIALTQEMALIQEDKTMCPYCNTEAEICNASCSALEIDDRMRIKYCTNEDYDDCPIFLVKKLRLFNNSE